MALFFTVFINSYRLLRVTRPIPLALNAYNKRGNGSCEVYYNFCNCRSANELHSVMIRAPHYVRVTHRMAWHLKLLFHPYKQQEL